MSKSINETAIKTSEESQQAASIKEQTANIQEMQALSVQLSEMALDLKNTIKNFNL